MATSEQLTRWREQYRQLFQVIIDGREEMRGWAEDTVLFRPHGDDARDCLASIKNAMRHYWELIKQLPNVYEFTDSELEKRDGKVEQFIQIATELVPVLQGVEHGIEKLTFLCLRSDEAIKRRA